MNDNNDDNTENTQNNADTVDLSDVKDPMGLLNALMEAQNQSGGGETRLLAACRFGHEALVRNIINQGESVNSPNEQGATPLIASALRGHTDIVKLLLDKKANVNHCTGNGDSAISLAIWKGKSEAAILLLEAKADVSKTDRYGDTVLHDAAKHGDPDLIRRLLSSGQLAVDKPNRSGSTALLNAIRGKHADAVKLLLESRAIVTPATFKAAGPGDSPIKKLLKEHEGGVIPSMKDEEFMKHISEGLPISGEDFIFFENKDTALIVCARSGREDMVNGILAKYPEEVNRTNSKNSTALVAAAMRGHVGICEALLEAKAEVNTRTVKGDSALSLSIWKDKTETALLLLEYKADPSNIDSYGDTVLHDLARNGNTRVMLKILTLIADQTFQPQPTATSNPKRSGKNSYDLSVCSVCGETNGLSNCSRCKKIAYCGTKCQTKHWKFHKTTCNVQEQEQDNGDMGSKSNWLQSGSISAVRQAVNMRNKKDVSPLLCGIKNKKNSVVTLLIDAKADIIDNEIFQSAASSEEIQKQLQDALTLKTTPLFKTDSAEAYLKNLTSGSQKNIDTPLSGSHKAPPIVWAALNGEAEIVQAILKIDAKAVEMKDSRGWGPLISAANSGRIESLRILLKYKTEDFEGLRALGAAIAQKQTAAALVLLDENEKGEFYISTEQLNKVPLLAMAVSTNNYTVLVELLERGVDVNAKDSEGSTVLHIALQMEKPKTKIIRILTDFGALIDPKVLEIIDID